jgi:hypothetical protein
MKKNANRLRSLDGAQLATVTGGLDIRQQHRGNFQKTNYHWVSPGSVWDDLLSVASKG